MKLKRDEQAVSNVAFIFNLRRCTLDRVVAMIRGERDESISGSKALVPNSSTAPSTMLSDTNLRNEIDAAAQAGPSRSNAF